MHDKRNEFHFESQREKESESEDDEFFSIVSSCCYCCLFVCFLPINMVDITILNEHLQTRVFGLYHSPLLSERDRKLMQYARNITYDSSCLLSCRIIDFVHRYACVHVWVCYLCALKRAAWQHSQHTINEQICTLHQKLFRSFFPINS